MVIRGSKSTIVNQLERHRKLAEIVVKLDILKGERLVGKLVDKVYGSIAAKLCLLLGGDEEIQYIIDELEIMSAFLRDAEEKQASNEASILQMGVL